MKIESRDNQTLKLVRSLQKRKFRGERGLFVAEGKKLVDEALAALQPEMILVSEQFDASAYSQAVVVRDSLFDSLCDTKTPQGILGVFPIPQVRLEATAGVIVALEDVQDPGNVGTIIRSADAFGAAGVLCSEGCADLYAPKVLRSTMGSIFHLPVVRCPDFAGELLRLRAEGCRLIAGDLAGGEMEGSSGFDALIVGNEGRGISPEVRGICDALWRIPMKGAAESLNAAVAAGIMLYKLAGL